MFVLTIDTALVEFKPTSHPELDAILKQYHETLFIPQALSKYHRRLVYRPSKRPILVNEPGVTVTLPNDVDYKLKPMALGDRPIKYKALAQILQILSSTDDQEAWSNLPRFLEGMKASKDSVPPYFMEKIARKAFERGKEQIIMRCAEDADKTAFHLSIPGVTEQTMLGCHRRAADASFRGDALLSAVKQADRIARLLESEEHCNRSLPASDVDMRQSLMVVGVLLELAAAKSIDVNGGKDSEDQVASYVAKALALSKDGFNNDRSTAAAANPETKSASWILQSKTNWLVNYVPLWHGMRLAARVDGAIKPGLRRDFDSRTKDLQKQIKAYEADVRQTQEGKPRLALQLYEQVRSL